MEDEKKMPSTEEANNDIKDNSIDTLDALLFDSDDDINSSSDEEVEDFDAFMAEYRSLLTKSFAETAKESAPEVVAESKEKDESVLKKEYEEEYLAPIPKKQSQKKKAKKQEPEQPVENKSDWDEDITLAPEEYEALPVEGNELLDEMPEEFIPDFDLGEATEDNKFQLSMSFAGEGNPDVTASPTDEENNKYDPDKPRAIDWAFDIAEMFVFVLAAVMILTTFVFKHSVVEGPSMNNTLADGDHLIISDLFYYPERGDVIVFEDYSTILKKAVVKRVIGLPGETVEVKVDTDGIVRVYINGELLPEEYAYNAKDCDIAKYHAPITLGENEVFVMGDNRYHSTDSRNGGVGPIDIDSILGKVLFRFFPFDKFGEID